jgi:hypothetical protein
MYIFETKQRIRFQVYDVNNELGHIEADGAGHSRAVRAGCTAARRSREVKDITFVGRSFPF